jgi:prolyl 4-hydroxylase
LIEAQRRPSTVTDDNGDPEFRTSETCDLFPSDTLVSALDVRMADIINVPTNLGEVMQGQRYLAGQEFKAPTDWFEPSGIDYPEHCAVRGQRT